MKLYLEDDDGKMYEIEKTKVLHPGDVVVFLNQCMRPKDIGEIEKNLSIRMGRKVVVLDARFRDIVTLPLLKRRCTNLSRPTAKIDLTHRSRV